MPFLTLFLKKREILRPSFLLKTFFTLEKIRSMIKMTITMTHIFRHCSLLEEVSLKFLHKETIL